MRRRQEEEEVEEEVEPEVVEEVEEVVQEVEQPVAEPVNEPWYDGELTLADDEPAEEFSPDKLAAALSEAFKERWWEEEKDEAAA